MFNHKIVILRRRKKKLFFLQAKNKRQWKMDSNQKTWKYKKYYQILYIGGNSKINIIFLKMKCKTCLYTLQCFNTRYYCCDPREIYCILHQREKCLKCNDLNKK